MSTYRAPCRVGLALALLGLVAPLARAQTSSNSLLVPYQGRLEKDGIAVDGAVDLRVGLFTTAAGNPQACLESTSLSGCGLWADEFLATPTHAGQFILALGSQLALPASVFQTAPVYIGVAVRQQGGSSYLALAGLQQLQSVPYAVLSLTSPDLNVAGSLAVNGKLGVGIANPATKLQVDNGEVRVRASHNTGAAIAEFIAANGTQGIAIGYSRIGTTGTNPDQDLFLTPRGTGSVVVEGPLLTAASKNNNGTLSTYYVNQRRLLYEAPYSANTPVRAYVAIPEATLADYCGDEDGCRVTLRMRDWSGGGGAVYDRTATSFSLHLAYGANVGGKRQWRREALANSPNTSTTMGNESDTDNNGTTNHILRNHDCYLTDGSYTVGGGDNGDAALGMGLLNYNHSNYTCTCQLIIDD